MLNSKRTAEVFENVHQLSTKPKEIDVLSIMKNPENEIQKNIDRIFRTYNIVEYKSSVDYLSIDVFKCCMHMLVFTNVINILYLAKAITVIKTCPNL